MKLRLTVVSALLTLTLPVAANCADAQKATEKSDAAVEAVKAQVSAGGHAMGGADGAAETSGDAISGKVVETMDSGGYTYANLQRVRKTVWVAFPTHKVQVGDTLSFNNCVAMHDFQSKSLNRTFDLVFFCGAPQTPAKGAEAKPAAADAKKSPGSAGALSAAVGQKIKVDKASGPNAYTIAELYAKSAALNGKQVVVKGQVVKVSSGIMARNWIHLQDGTGNAKQKTQDLVITSSERPSVGEVVTISGTVAKDKDFGSGYKYNLIIEKGSVKK